MCATNGANVMASREAMGAGVEAAKRGGLRELVMLGTGVSTGLPQISCAMASAHWECEVCRDGLRNVRSPNRRCNVCALLRVGNRAVLIDCGKTMREAALRFFPGLQVGGVDAIVLTHGHADAMLGLDDVRDMQPRQGVSTPVYLSDDTHAVCKRVFPYLMATPLGGPGQEKGVSRRVASIDWCVREDYEQFQPLPDVDMWFAPVPVLHGGEYVCWGFVIVVGTGADRKTIAYLSDVKKIPEKSMDFLREAGHIDVLIVDALFLTKKHDTHFNLEEATDLARYLRPDVTRCVGMGCRMGMHDEVNAELSKLMETEQLDIQLAHDGLCLPL